MWRKEYTLCVLAEKYVPGNIYSFAHTYVHTYVYTYISQYGVYVYTHLQRVAATGKNGRNHTHIHTYIHTYISTEYTGNCYFKVLVESYIHTYIHTYIHQYGVYTFATGDCYCGEWVESCKHGKGKIIWSDGRIFEGSFVRDCPVSYQRMCMCWSGYVTAIRKLRLDICGLWLVWVLRVNHVCVCCVFLFCVMRMYRLFSFWRGPFVCVWPNTGIVCVRVQTDCKRT